jgi:hypothetical protein
MAKIDDLLTHVSDTDVGQRLHEAIDEINKLEVKPEEPAWAMEVAFNNYSADQWRNCGLAEFCFEEEEEEDE